MRAAACLLLALATLLAYAPLWSNDFVNYDDDVYVTSNRHVRAGVTADGMRWALITSEQANWHPLTWISHMVDCALFGLSPRGHHGVSLLLHIANTLLLFVAFDRMTAEPVRAFLVAAVFALHPLHVESVAWVAERKDVLSGLFWMTTLLAYAHYAQRPGRGRLLIVLASFVLALIAKPMAVTLPFVLLLLDVWPLRRTPSIREKLPLLVAAAASCVVTLWAQQQGKALGTFERFPLWVRVENALVATAGYVRKAVWPSDLAVFYPHPGAGIPTVNVLLSALFLAAVSVAAVVSFRKRPWGAVGWLWMLGTLVPVIGLVQVGEQAMADRYAYIPLIGLSIVAAWAIPEKFVARFDASANASRGGRERERGPGSRSTRATRSLSASLGAGLVGLGVAAMLAVLGWLTFRQVAVWRNSETLFLHALAVTGRNHVAEINLGLDREAKEDAPGAIARYQRALAIAPKSVIAHHNLGRLLRRDPARLDEALRHLRIAIAADPDNSKINVSLGIALAAQGKIDEAAVHFERAVRADPESAEARYDWGTALLVAGRWDDAAVEYEHAIRLEPKHPKAHHNLAVARFYRGEYAEAWREVALAREYGFAPAPDFLATLSQRMPDPNASPGRR